MGWAFAVAIAGAVASGRAARAEDAPPDPKLARLVELETKLAADVAQKNPEALSQDARAAVALYKEAEGKAPYRERTLKILSTLAGNKNDDVAKTAIQAAGETGDVDGAGKILRRFLKPCDDPEASVGLTTALQVVSTVPDPDLVEPLLAMVTDSKNYTVAAKSLECLSSFRGAKRKREKIVEELVKTVIKDKPGVASRAAKENQTNPEGGTGNQQGGTQNRWAALSAVLAKSLNKLTGQSLSSPEEWSEAVKSHKGRLGELFREG